MKPSAKATSEALKTVVYFLFGIMSIAFLVLAVLNGLTDNVGASFAFLAATAASWVVALINTPKSAIRTQPAGKSQQPQKGSGDNPHQAMSSSEREAYLARLNSFHYAPNKYAGKSAKVQSRHNPTICPKCGSHNTMVIGSGKKVAVGRAIVGDMVAGPAGAVVGAMTGKKNRVEMICRDCGKRWYI
jgi:hypothetical protein